MIEIAKQNIETERLLLRPVVAEDVSYVATFLDNFEVTKWLASIPYPYPREMAQDFLKFVESAWADGSEYVFAIVPRDKDHLIGVAGLKHPNAEAGELGYWLAEPYWGRGYMTEAARAVTNWAFDTVGVDRVKARHFDENQASSRVLAKCGLRHTGERTPATSMSLNREITNLWMVLTRAARDLNRETLAWRTERLTLRPLRESDCNAIQTLASDFEVARWLSSIPYPYPEDGAVQFFEQQKKAWADGTNYGIAMELTDTGAFLGILGVMREDPEFWEVGYWLGQPYWGQGYTTEALASLASWAFDTFCMAELRARYFQGNDASANVLRKCGFKENGNTVTVYAKSLDREVVCNWMTIKQSEGGACAPQ